MRTALREKPWLGRAAGMTAALAVMGAAITTSLSIQGNAKADVPVCSAAQFTANVESGTGIAFVDVGAGKTATFVCISSAAFSGGQSQPITANGTQANGCYVVDGIGASVVSVFRERPDVRPDCMPITAIAASTIPVTAATPSPSATPGGSTVSPTATAPTVAPTNPPAATATPRPNTPVPAATQAPTQAPAQPTTTARPPSPPSTGSGTASPADGGINLPLFLALGLLAVSVAAGGWTIIRQRSR